jgi:predicted MFS family arabinose efflux permease
LWQRDFRSLFVGETVSRAGSAITVVAMPLVAVSTLDVSVFTVGVLEAAAWLPWLLLGLPAGAWVDRFDRRPVLVSSNVASAVLFASVPVAAWAGLLTVSQLVVVAFCAGIVKVFFRTALQAYLPVVVPSDRLAEGNAKLQGVASAAEVAGPGLAGVMAQVLGAVTALLADAVSFVVSAICLLRIRIEEPPNEDPRRTDGLLEKIRTGIRYVATDPYLRTLTLFGALGNLVLVAIQTLLVLFLIRVVRVEAGVAGLLLTGLGIGGILGALSVNELTRRLGSARVLVLCEATTAPFALLLPMADRGWRLALFMVGGTVMAAGVVAGSIIASSFRQSYCPPYLLGRVSSVVSFLVFGAMPVGALLAGAAGSALGVRTALWLLAGALTLSVLVLIFSPISRRRDLPTRAPDHLTARPDADVLLTNGGRR